MQRYKLFLFFIFFTPLAFAQVDDEMNHGTIKISKPKSKTKYDSIYIKAEINFLQFQVGNKYTIQQNLIPRNRVIQPTPVVLKGSTPFDFNQFFNKEIEIIRNDLGDKNTDTVRFQIKILDNGKSYYNDVSPLVMMNGVPAYYDKQLNAYKLDPIHLKCMNVLKKIKKWRPAYMILEVKDTFKKVTVIKPKKKNLSAIGILTVVFSTDSFE